MKRTRTTPPAADAATVASLAADTDPAAPEPSNVIVDCLENRTKIGKAIVAAGRVDFPLTMTQAKGLEALGKVRIVGIA